MVREVEVTIPLARVPDVAQAERRAVSKARLEAPATAVELVRRSVDARPARPVYRIRARVYSAPDAPKEAPREAYDPVSGRRSAVVVGCGPAGMFAALRLIQLGIRPVILERGKPVEARERDRERLDLDGLLDPESNYCFGEGGAGTFSDGKLYTRATKRGDVGRILRILMQHGADPDILVDAHPHIGSDRLPAIVRRMRETILSCRGEIRFGARLAGITGREGSVRAVSLADGEELAAEALILATGHSARDVYDVLRRSGVALEPKPFAVGVRVEHPQELINDIQYNHAKGARSLPAAAYTLAATFGGRGVFSFCMCPGGQIVPAFTDREEIVTNGMSAWARDSGFANSGLVTSVLEEDLRGLAGPAELAGLELQSALERAASRAGGGRGKAPAQRLTDFLASRASATLPACSYRPGVGPAPVHELLPAAIYQSLTRGIYRFGEMLRGYLTSEALVVAPETRTSSPVRIPRDPETLMHPGLRGLFPAGEGSGYAGGIVSAAMDGERCAEAAAAFLEGGREE